MFMEALLVIVIFFVIFGLLYYSILKDHFAGKVFSVIVLSVYVILVMIYLGGVYKIENNTKVENELENICMDIENKYKNYDRDFIRINPNEIMLIHMFKRDVDHQLEDAVLDDNQQYYEDITKIRKEAAHQLVLQFEGHSSRSFIKALKEECEKWLEEDNKRMNK